ncbi:MAG: hypothetical protein V4501_04580 [Pseudomonadota bacterium]
MFKEKFDTKAIAAVLRSPAFIVISIIASAFGYWFALNQVNAVSLGGLPFYPKEFFGITIFKCYLTIIAFYGLSRLILLNLSANKLTSLAVAISFTPLLLVFVNYPVYWIAGIIGLYQIAFLLLVLDREDYHRLASFYLTDAIVFMLFFFLHFIFTTRFSPLHWNMSILVPDGYYTDEAVVLSPMFRGFVLAKQFAFSFIDHSQWAGIMHTPFLLNSPLMQLLTFVFDLPSASFEAFHIILMTLYFILIVIGSFGFYLFLKYAAKVHLVFALWGGILFSFSGTPVVDQIMGADNGVFFSSYAVFPIALLLISLAFEKGSKTYALWAAVALALQLFIYAPHPEGLLYSTVFYFVYAFGLVLFTPQLKLKQKISLFSSSIITFLILTAFDVVPILFDRFTGNMYVVGHIGDIQTVSIEFIQPYINVVLIALPISLILQGFRKHLSPVYLSSIFLVVCMTLFLLLGRHAWFMTWVAQKLHFGIHFTYYWRFGIFYCVAAYTVMVFALDAITSLSYQWVSNKYFKMLGVQTNVN